jgi:hypothetical protein
MRQLDEVLALFAALLGADAHALVAALDQPRRVLAEAVEGTGDGTRRFSARNTSIRSGGRCAGAPKRD